MEFFERLQYAMKLRNIPTQAELARRSEIRRSAINDYIHNRYEPKQEAIYKLSKALDVSETWLMGISDDINRVPDDLRKMQDSDIESSCSINESLKNEPELLKLYEIIQNSEDLKVMLDSSKDLTAEDLRPVLILIQGIRKAKGLDND